MVLPRIPKVLYPLAALLAVAGLVAAAMAETAPGQVRVDQTRFLKGPADEGNFTVEVVLYLTCPDRASRGVRIAVYLYPKVGGLAEERRDLAVGVIPGRTTEEVRFPLTIPGNATQPWAIDFLVFEDGLLTQQGHGSLGFRGPFLDWRLAELEASAGDFVLVR